MAPRDRDRDDRDKLSFSERDKMLAERRKQGGGGSGGGRGRRDPNAMRGHEYSAYKSQLNKLFEGGGIDQLVKAKLGDAGEEAGVGEGAKSRKQAAKAIAVATQPKAILAALADYRDAGFGFPEDEEALSRLLDLDDEDIVLEVLQTLTRLLDDPHSAGLKKAGSFKNRIRSAKMTVDDPDVEEAADALLKRL